MNTEISFEGVKTYASAENVRKAIAKTGDEKIRHMIVKTENNRYHPVFIANEKILSETGIHFRWPVV